jgi:tetratricopeptide (TPR) repeat protein
MGLLDFFSKKNYLQDLHQEQEKFLQNNPVPKDTEDALVRRASYLMTTGNFNESLEIYQQLVAEYPAKKGLYLSQVGASYYFLGEYDLALEAYLLSRNNGMNPDMINDNIWEVCEERYQQTKNLAFIRQYLELCPEGNHQKKATKLL